MVEPYNVFIDSELFVVRWRDPNLAGTMDLSQEIEAHHRKIGVPLLFVFMIGVDCPPPSKQNAEIMLRQYEGIYDLTQNVRAVVLSGSLRQTVMRSVMTAMTLAAGLRGQPFAVDRTVEDLALVIQQKLGCDAHQLRKQMVANGIVTAKEAGLVAAAG